mmetsp:Transcript_31384/g.82551  ORF Transcript_31384/g.82551 Transcript_31384/m.82551 type:complete len:452 (+) Transcript_31384:31-1386(+)
MGACCSDLKLDVQEARLDGPATSYGEGDVAVVAGDEKLLVDGSAGSGAGPEPPSQQVVQVEEPVAEGAGGMTEGDEPTAEFKPSAAAAFCPLCDKQFRPRGGNAFDSVLKHLRSSQDDAAHQALAAALSAGKARCPACGAGPFGSAAEAVEHLLCTAECAEACPQVAARLATEGVGQKKQGGGKKNKEEKKATTADKREVGRTLYSAAKGNDPATVSKLLKESTWPPQEVANLAFDDGYTALMTAAEAGFATVVEVLLDKGADPMKKNSYGQSAIHLAALNNRRDAVEALLAPEGSRQALLREPFQSSTALLLACRHGFHGVAEVLLQSGADVNERSEQSETPMGVAIAKGHTATVEVLAPRCGAAWSDAEGRTALFLAVTAEPPDEAIVRILAQVDGVDLRRQFSPPGCDGKPVTLAILAQRAGHPEIAAALMPRRKGQPGCGCFRVRTR